VLFSKTFFTRITASYRMTTWYGKTAMPLFFGITESDSVHFVNSGLVRLKVLEVLSELIGCAAWIFHTVPSHLPGGNHGLLQHLDFKGLDRSSPNRPADQN